MAFPFAAAALALQVGGMFSGASKAKAQARAQATIDEANAFAANLNRDSQNRVQAAVSGLKSYATSINNQRQGAAAGAKITALSMNVGRALDQMSQGSTKESLQAAEQLGAFTAQAAAAGTGGSSIDLVKSTMGLRRAMQQNNLTRSVKMLQQDAKDKMAAATSELFQSFDVTTSVAGMDYGVTTPPARMSPDSFMQNLTKLDMGLVRDVSYGIFGTQPAAPVETASITYIE